MPASIKKKINKYRKNRREFVVVEEISRAFTKGVSLLKKELGASAIGDYLEFGVHKGTSLSCMYQVLKEQQSNHVRLFGFDSFEGLPETAAYDDEGAWRPGEFKYPYKATRKYLDEKGIEWDKTILVKGWFSDTLNEQLIEQYAIQKVSLIMIDCDMYLSAKEALNFCAPLIKDKAVVYFDDWASRDNLAERNLGEKRAFNEFLEDNPHLTAKEIDRYIDIGGKINGAVFLVSTV
ncbi:TylF/MycF/NovP-related O-methyltransferase [Catalinimonas niigatensis]|uniref:TylF/MycF/NovP-related O-methyltransferase n=1 Tax=Catalinimonas niigatensis TaxID=1397264 RepID=UPI00266595AF|nr:TylF/MycF/NovP-related O-methyltransferase [Catalinimonas niigatensis]WPP49831.1 TylF/MycF/NovP-related O-methyltransferase [Catalinimonas niigatensis]